MKKTLYAALLLIIINGFFSCHLFYKRLTRGGWAKDTTWIKYPNLPISVRSIITKYANGEATISTIDDIPPLISLDTSYKALDITFSDAYSKKIIIPYGLYFKIGKSKYFIDYLNLNSPLIYFDNCLYYDAHKYFDPSYTNYLFDKYQRIPYEKRFFVRYELKGRKKVK